MKIEILIRSVVNHTVIHTAIRSSLNQKAVESDHVTTTVMDSRRLDKRQDRRVGAASVLIALFLSLAAPIAHSPFFVQTAVRWRSTDRERGLALGDVENPPARLQGTRVAILSASKESYSFAS